MLNRGETRQVFTVAALTQEIKRLLEGRFATLWVEGEISNMTAARSGHWYFTLKDDKAQLSCVMFRGQNARLSAPPREGAQVLLSGRVNVYEPRGSYQLVVSTLEDRGAGRLREQFEALKRRLAQEGLFDAERKRPLPLLPRRIALVTSPEGAAVRDMIRVILRRFPKAAIVLVPSLVQGEAAPGQLVAAIARAQSLERVDVLIVGRGGGSIEDLWAFNDEAVARAIAASRVPVVSAVGHETDVTIADFVADVRAATPSVAGELVVPLLADLEAGLVARKHRLARAIAYRIKAESLRLHSLAGRLPRPDRRLADLRLRLDQSLRRLNTALVRRQAGAREELGDLRERLARMDPGRRLERGRHQLERARQRLELVIGGRLRSEREGLNRRGHRLAPALGQIRRDARERLALLGVRLDALSPLGVLARGYSLVTLADGRILRRAAEVEPGDTLRVFPSEGELTATVTARQARIPGNKPQKA